MFRKVIIGVDERESHRDAIKLARELVTPDGSLTLARVHVSYPLYGKGMTAPIEEEEHEQDAQLLRDVSAASGISSTVSIDARSVGRGLHELVEQQGADLLVLGSTQKGLIGRVLVGDDTRDAINGAPCAVAVAPTAYAQTTTVLREIGVAYNETDEARHALAVAREIAAAHHTKLSVFEAVGLPLYLYAGFGTPYGDVAGYTLESVHKALATIDGVEAHAAFGDAVEELTVYSASVDLLVVGSRGFGPLGRLVHSSTSLGLARTARCPLLILPRHVRSGGSADADGSSPVPAIAAT